MYIHGHTIKTLHSDVPHPISMPALAHVALNLASKSDEALQIGCVNLLKSNELDFNKNF